MTQELLDTLTHWLAASSSTLVLTGAGVSTESGIPDFRSDEGGIWSQADPMQVASAAGFFADPVGFYQFWGGRFIGLVEARPNVTHEVLAVLEARGHIGAVITQNIDDLHHQAGSRNVYEVHGNFRTAACLGCRQPSQTLDVIRRVRSGEEPRCPSCGSLVKPDVVLFGEALPPSFVESMARIAQAELLLVLGSSLEVYPAAELVPMAKQAGAKVAIINREPTELDDIADLVIHGQLGPLMTALRERLAL